MTDNGIRNDRIIRINHAMTDTLMFCNDDLDDLNNYDPENEDPPPLATTTSLPSLFRTNYKEQLRQLQCCDASDEEPIDQTDDLVTTEDYDMETMADYIVLSSQRKVLQYESFLKHQTLYYYDDCKHIDYHYIDYGYCGYQSFFHNNKQSTVWQVPNHIKPLIIQQNKSISGKGGFCWDAAFILSEYIVHSLITAAMSTSNFNSTQQSALITAPPDTSTDNGDNINNVLPSTRNDEGLSIIPCTRNVIRMIELGCGTGICGMFVAKSLQISLSMSSSSLVGKKIDDRNDHHAEEGSQTLIRPMCDSFLDVIPPTSPSADHNMKNSDSKRYQIMLTDMDGPIQKLIQNNLHRNFRCSLREERGDDEDDDVLDEYIRNHSQFSFNAKVDESCKHNEAPKLYDETPCILNTTGSSRSCCSIDKMVLDWDEYSKIITVYNEQHICHNQYDIIFGSDIVATLYNPIHLAQTIYILCHAKSIVYISYKERYTPIHETFQNMITELFHHVKIFNTCSGDTIFSSSPNHDDPLVAEGTEKSRNDNDTNGKKNTVPWTSRNLNPNVYIIVARNKKHMHEVPPDLLIQASATPNDVS